MNKIGRAQYQEIIEKLERIVKYYENSLEENEYTLKLSNGDSIYLTFPRNKIAHLLGINTYLLKDQTSKEESYKILKRLTNSITSYNDLKKRFDENNVGSIFSDYIDRKLEIFVELLKVRTNDMLFIIKYKADRSYTTSDVSHKCDYFIVREHIIDNKKKYSVLGIVKNENTYDNYAPVTSRMFNDYDELIEFLKTIAIHQEITYPCYLKVENKEKYYDKSFTPKNDTRLEYAKSLMNYANLLEAIPSNTKDSMFIINELIDSEQKNNTNYSIISDIKDCIVTGTFIEREELKKKTDDGYLPYDINLLVDAANDIICANYRNDEYKGNSYSEVKNENDDLKKQLEVLKLTLEEKDSIIKELENNNSKLESECNDKKQKLKVLTEAFKSIQ